MGINLSSISNQTILGKILRFPLKFLPKNIVVPILQGRLRGKKWILGSSDHGYWLGSYEHDVQRLFSEKMKQGMVFYDLGANVGYYSLLAAVLAEEKGKVFAFEPASENIAIIRKHCALNGVQNVEVIQVAVSNYEGFAQFQENKEMGHLSKEGNAKVKVLSLDKFAVDHPVPDFIKMDVETEELKVLEGAKSLLQRYHPQIILEAHGDKLRDDCWHYLADLGYKIEQYGRAAKDKGQPVLYAYYK